MLKRGAIAGLALILAVTCGCSRQEDAVPAAGDANVKQAVVIASPQEAVDEIYDSLKAYEATALNSLRLQEDLELSASDLSEYYGKISNANEGLADVIIALPKEDKRESIRLSLSKYKEKRIAEFENYDILDAYTISQDAVIYDQGAYIIMLMLADNEAAREIIDAYIPL